MSSCAVRTLSVTLSGIALGFDQMMTDRTSSPRSKQPIRYRSGSISLDLRGAIAVDERPGGMTGAWSSLPDRADDGPPSARSEYLSPSTTKIDPDGLSTRIHSAVHSHNDSRYSPGEA